MKLSKELKVIYLWAVISSFFLVIVWGVKESYDSSSYIHAWDTISNGQIDIFRTPVYPLFLGICKTIFGVPTFKYVVIILQHLLFLISIYHFNQMALWIIKNVRISFWITLFYAIYPAITTWNNCILTESFAVVGVVFLLYYSIRLYQRFSLQSTFLFLFWFIFLVFLRPSFLYLLPIYAVFWSSCLLVKRSSNILSGMLCTVVVIFFQLMYISHFKQTYGVFSPSSVSVINQYYMTRQNGLIYVNGIINNDIKEEIKRSIIDNGLTTNNHSVIWKETSGLIHDYPLKDVQQVISVSMRNNPLGYLKKAGGRAYKAANYPILVSKIDVFSTFFDMFGANISFLYLFLLIYAIIIMYWLIKKKKIPYFSILLFMIGVSNMVTIIVGAQQEWSRLLLPSISIYLLMMGQLCGLLKVKKLTSIDFE